MKEQLISFETAVLAKEKGFEYKERFFAHFHSDKNKLSTWTPDDWDIQNSSAWRDLEIPAPTQSLLQKWLRDTHSIIVSVDIQDDRTYFISLTAISPNSTVDNIWGNYKTYEEALENGLKEALELIKK